MTGIPSIPDRVSMAGSPVTAARSPAISQSPGSGVADLALPPGLLDFEQTIPRRLVHRRGDSEVFVCGSTALDQDQFAVAVQMPRAHLLWSDRVSGFHDSLMAIEAGRQASIMLAHAYYGLPPDIMMIARSSTVRVKDRAAFRDDGATPLEGAFVMRLAEKASSGGVPVSMRFEGDLFLAGANAMSMSGTLVFTPQEDYEILRAQSRARKQLSAAPAARRLPALVAPGLVGRRLQDNVVIGDDPCLGSAAGEGAGLIRHAIIVDQANPCFFDHPLDHVPGQLLLEACRQSAIITAVRDRVLPGPACMVTACTVSLSDFVELDEIADCSATVVPSPVATGAACLRVSVRQFGTQVGDVELQLSAVCGIAASDPDRNEPRGDG
jgi:hypothetical protein